MSDSVASEPPDSSTEEVVETVERGCCGLIVIGLGVLLAGSLVTAWLARRPIAGTVIDRYLAQHNIPAQYEITQIGPQTQLLRNVVIGDPKHPDLAARHVEINLAWSLSGVMVDAIRADGVRLRMAMDADGMPHLGALDRLLPKSAGGPFRLPSYAVALRDTRIDLASPWGPAVINLAGDGRINDGFAGAARLRARRLTGAGCTITMLDGIWTVHTRNQALAIDGPLRGDRLDCAARGVALARPVLTPKVMLRPGFDGWSGNIGMAADGGRFPGGTVAGLHGRIGVGGRFADPPSGRVEALADGLTIDRAARIQRGARFTGSYGWQDGRARVAGDLDLRGAALDPALTGPLHQALQGAAGSPAGAIADGLDRAIDRAARSFDLVAGLDLQQGEPGMAIALRQPRLTSASGAMLITTDGSPITVAPGGLITLGNGMTLSGGGFPTTRARIAPFRAGGAISGRIVMAPLVSGDNRIAFGPIDLRGVGGPAGQIVTGVAIDGQFPGGRVDGLVMPVFLRVGPTIAFGNGCAPVRYTRLQIGGATFTGGQHRLCPLAGDAIIRRDRNGRLAGGIRVDQPVLHGSIGSNPLSVTVRAMEIPLSPLSFRLTDGRITLGTGATAHRIQFARIDGAADRLGIAGRFAALDGHLGNVPLRFDQGEGQWTFRQSVLDLAGAFRMTDRIDGDPRFKPLSIPDAHVRMAGSRITATGTARHPASGLALALVNIAHDLRSGAGHADIDVPGVYFRTNGLQPDMLTSMTLGVIANVRGDVQGHGRIDWAGGTVTSSGTFGTDDMDFAAAFGPVTGFRTRVQFTDLLGLQSAAAQEIRIGSANPGMEVRDGLVHYRLIGNNRVQVEGGRWPFNGGYLVLAPTILDLNHSMERRLTFRVEGLDAAKFLQQLGYQNLSASGIFDGEIPMVFDDRGGRIEGGYLVVREGGGTIAYVGELTRAQLGTWGKMAFDALRSLRYRKLRIDLDGALDGEIVTRVSFDGINQEPLTPNARLPLSGVLRKLPFRFNINIRAPFRSLMNSATLLSDPRATLRNYLPHSVDEIPGVGPDAPVAGPTPAPTPIPAPSPIPAPAPAPAPDRASSFPPK